MNLQNYNRVLVETKSYDARLVAVSKTRPVEAIKAMYSKGQRIFGENRVQELVEKKDLLPEDVEWHLIGHLQKNKVKYIAPFVQMIHSVESWELLNEINKRAMQHERVIDCLLQMHIAQESSKFGMNLEELNSLLERLQSEGLTNVRVVGMMGMATFTDVIDDVRTEFRYLKSLFDTTKETFFKEDADFKEISMGMSGDYDVALKEGSTMVRVGSLIF